MESDVRCRREGRSHGGLRCWCGIANHLAEIVRELKGGRRTCGDSLPRGGY